MAELPNSTSKPRGGTTSQGWVESVEWLGRTRLIGLTLLGLLGLLLVVAWWRPAGAQVADSSRSMAGPLPGTNAPMADIQPTKNRTLQLDIDYEPDQRSRIQSVELIVSRDQGQTWEVMDTVTADKEFLKFEAKQDGLYFVNMVINYRNGTRDPMDPSRAPAQLKLLVDTVAPVVTIAQAIPQGDEIAVEWTIADPHLDRTKTQVFYKASASPLNDWQPVPQGLITARGTRFRPTVQGPLLVRVVASDFAGNMTDVAREVPVGVGVTTSSSMSARGSSTSSGAVNPPPPILPTNPAAIPAPDFQTSSAAPVIPPMSPTGPVAPVTLPAGAAIPVVAPASTPAVSPVLPMPVSLPNTTAAAPTGTNPAPSPEWNQPTAKPSPGSNPGVTSGANSGEVLAISQPAGRPGNPSVMTNLGTSPAITPGMTPGMGPIAAAKPSLLPVEYLRVPELDLAYQIEAGPSGVSHFDLYVTRDEGRSWQKWSSHPGTENPLRVRLSAAFSQVRDGDYGLRVVAVSKAGLADDPPTAGQEPEYRIHLDTTPPLLRILAPTAVGNAQGSLNLRWEATDAQFGERPIKIEWSEAATGPWRLVHESQDGQVENTGSYEWVLPKSLPTLKVFLRMTAVDRAGNLSVATTSQPVLIDLMKPKAKILRASPTRAQ